MALLNLTKSGINSIVSKRYRVGLFHKYIENKFFIHITQLSTVRCEFRGGVQPSDNTLDPVREEWQVESPRSPSPTFPSNFHRWWRVIKAMISTGLNCCHCTIPINFTSQQNMSPHSTSPSKSIIIDRFHLVWRQQPSLTRFPSSSRNGVWLWPTNSPTFSLWLIIVLVWWQKKERNVVKRCVTTRQLSNEWKKRGKMPKRSRRTKLPPSKMSTLSPTMFWWASQWPLFALLYHHPPCLPSLPDSNRPNATMIVSILRKCPPWPVYPLFKVSMQPQRTISLSSSSSSSSFLPSQERSLLSLSSSTLMIQMSLEQTSSTN